MMYRGVQMKSIQEAEEETDWKNWTKSECEYTSELLIIYPPFESGSIRVHVLFIGMNVFSD
jgi:hypothetical protein